MSEQKKNDDQKAAAEAKSAEQKPVTKGENLGPASESGDPVVQRLLAEQDVARQNGDDEAVKEFGRQLTELGYS